VDKRKAAGIHPQITQIDTDFWLSRVTLPREELGSIPAEQTGLTGLQQDFQDFS